MSTSLIFTGLENGCSLIYCALSRYLKVQPHYLSTFWTPPRLEALRLASLPVLGSTTEQWTIPQAAAVSASLIFTGLETGTFASLVVLYHGTRKHCAVNSVINISDRSGASRLGLALWVLPHRCARSRTEARLAWKVVLYCSRPRIHLFACTHPSVSNSLVCNDWSSYKHQSTARVQTRLDCGSLLYISISFYPVFQTCLDCGSFSAHTHQYPALCFKHVWIMDLCLYASISLQPFDQTRSDCGSLLFTNIVSTLCFKHVWNVYPCLRTRISFQHCVFKNVGLWFRVWVQASASCFLGLNTFGFWFLVVYKHQTPPVSQNMFRLRFLVCVHASVPALCFECVWIVDPCLCTRIRLQPCSNTFDYGLLVCSQVSLS